MNKETERDILQKIVAILDSQESMCRECGAALSRNSLEKPKGGNSVQNGYYWGNVSMAQAIAWELQRDIYKSNGHHVLVRKIAR